MVVFGGVGDGLSVGEKIGIYTFLIFNYSIARYRRIQHSWVAVEEKVMCVTGFVEKPFTSPCCKVNKARK